MSAHLQDARLSHWTASVAAHRSFDQSPRVIEWLAAAANDRCFYCGCETFLSNQSTGRHALRFRTRLGISGGKFLEWHRATTEHLVRRADGGDDRASNLALACQFCNSARGDLPSDIWAIVVAALINVGRHPCVSWSAI